MRESQDQGREGRARDDRNTGGRKGAQGQA